MTSLLNTDQPSPADPPREAGFTWTPQDLEASRAVLGGVTDDPREVIVLTDEEVVALDGLQNSQMVPTPWLDRQAVTRDDLGGIALRGLIARKMVALGPVLDAAGELTGDVDLTSVQEIAGTLMLRRTAQFMLRVERQSNAGTRWIYCYTHTGQGVLLEDIDPNGLHVFGATTVAGAAEYIRAVANDFDAPGGTTDPIRYTSVEFESLDAEPAPFAGAEGATTLVAFQQGRESFEVAVVYAGPERIGLLVPDTASDSFTASGITDQRLSSMLRAALGGEALLPA